MTHSVTLRASEDGPDRLGAYYHTPSVTEDDQPALFEVSRVIGGRVTKTVDFHQINAAASLIELDHPLSAGELTALSINWERITEPAVFADDTDFYDFRTPWPVGHVSLEIAFAGEWPACARGWATARLSDDQSLTDLPEVELSPNSSVQVAVRDVIGGAVRIAWSWSEPV
ncbi:hypothetical protein ACQBAT_00610 [Ornithinimicrobium sp. Y1847]|uniref:hypothetical protein n=1 Tax=Ornithinimicrobium sp. Y1847 TaxID=3405419 RepID=UPI003B6803DC